MAVSNQYSDEMIQLTMPLQIPPKLSIFLIKSEPIQLSLRLFVICYPQGFIMALGCAAIALVVLAIFLPVAMVFKQRKTGDESKSDYRVKGGN